MSYFGNHHTAWGRKLLSDSTSDIQDVDSLPIAVVLGILATLTLVVLVALCACGESDTEAKLKNVKKKSSSSNIKGAVNVEQEQQNVQIRPKTDTLESNGILIDLTNQNNAEQQARQSQASTTSSQMRPTSLRELPELPLTTAGQTDNQKQSRSSQISNDDYDHLGHLINPPPQAENYDHINLESPTEISEASPSDQTAESHYTQVNDRTYEACNGEAAAGSYSLTKVDPPYNKIRDDAPFNSTEPPYNRIRDGSAINSTEPPYNRVRNGSAFNSNEPPYNIVKDDLLYNTVKEEALYHDPPYNKIKDDDSSDPYNHIGDPYTVPRAVGAVEECHYELEPVDPDDPYTLVDNEDTELRVTVVSISRSSGFSNSSVPFQVSGSVSISDELLPLINAGFGASNDVTVTETTENDYAVVNKERNPITTSRRDVTPEVSTSIVPPEPPRAYGAEEINMLASTSLSSTSMEVAPTPPASSPPSVSTKTMSAPTPPSSLSRLMITPLPDSQSISHERFERQYSKVSARESLASMSARHALNPYEDVLDTENTYATVDGGSGDGVVTNPAPAPPSSPVLLLNNHHSNSLSINNRHIERHIDIQSSETYAEIGASAGGASNSLSSAPVPPSLDSLHSMKKHERRHLATPEDTTLDESVSHSHSSPSKRSSFSPTTALPGIPMGMSSSLHENDVILEPNYQTVKDSIDDAESENDPNYESVDDAKAKFREPKITRQHHYEEVSPTGSETASPNNVRTRVLNRHTYEDIDDVKEQKRNMKKESKDKNRL